MDNKGIVAILSIPAVLVIVSVIVNEIMKPNPVIGWITMFIVLGFPFIFAGLIYWLSGIVDKQVKKGTYHGTY